VRGFFFVRLASAGEEVPRLRLPLLLGVKLAALAYLTIRRRAGTRR